MDVASVETPFTVPLAVLVLAGKASGFGPSESMVAKRGRIRMALKGKFLNLFCDGVLK
jgi:hypothetical protein